MTDLLFRWVIKQVEISLARSLPLTPVMAFSLFDDIRGVVNLSISGLSSVVRRQHA